MTNVESVDAAAKQSPQLGALCSPQVTDADSAEFFYCFGSTFSIGIQLRRSHRRPSTWTLPIYWEAAVCPWCDLLGSDLKKEHWGHYFHPVFSESPLHRLQPPPMRTLPSSSEKNKNKNKKYLLDLPRAQSHEKFSNLCTGYTNFRVMCNIEWFHSKIKITTISYNSGKQMCN